MNSSTHFCIEELFQSHCQRLTNFIRKKVASIEDAEDIAQLAFIRVQAAAERSEIASPISYLYQTASNVMIDLKRRQKLHDAYVQATVRAEACSSGALEAVKSEPGPERVLSGKNDLSRIQALISQMPEKQRQAFLLHRVKGLAYADIAQTMGVSVSSVEKYILNALKQCRKAMQESEKLG
ncbi:RNA polymerase sigma factor [Agaribacterium haliotis]|uniref:RNA polymerase sigma factor n=1 Tax=Agaribacterium haliotis TaxID=2013869 RepID=UPI000BB545D9|nr:RNA polymerase sigma factor [Agaribacterium haliotis]